MTILHILSGSALLTKIIVFSTEVKLYDLGSVYLYVCISSKNSLSMSVRHTCADWLFGG